MSKLKYIYQRDLGALVDNANKIGLKKEDIIDIIKQGEIFVLIYEGEE